MALSRGPRDLICSARDCTREAQLGIQWRNPALHRGRHKTWLACQEHAEFLEQYLAYRNFERRAVPLDKIDEPFASD